MKEIRIARILAFIVDSALFLTVAGSLKGFFPVHEFGKVELFGQDWSVQLYYSVVIIPIYFILFDVFRDGQTLGKSLAGVRTVKNDLGRISATQKLVRSLIKTLDILLLPLSFLIFLFGNKTLHDVVVSSITVKEKAG